MADLSLMAAWVEEIYIAPEGGVVMARVDSVEAIAHRGLRGDRYCERRGYYTDIDECQVTLIEAEDLEEIADTTGLRILTGEHRRNLVTRSVRLGELSGRRFQIGGAVLEYDCPRPPCSYIQSITQPGMTQALMGRGGICATVVQSGQIRAKDRITVLGPPSENVR